VGYAGGLVALVLVTGFVMTDTVSGRTMLGIPSPFNLDASLHQAERLIGPLSAVWYLLFIIPLFLFTPDLPKRDIPLGNAARRGLTKLRTTLASLRHMPDIVRFLIARMLYTDALLAIFTFGGIYAASLFGWSAMQLGIYGIILSVAAAIGALCGGFLDDALGAKPVILGALGLLIAGLAGILAIDGGMASAAIGAGAFWGMDIAGFTRPAEGVYLVCSVLAGIAAGPLQASSRSLLARMGPPDRITEFFGLYAFSGKITAFLAPFVVGLVTTLTGSQRIGLAAILVFLLASVAVFIGVKGNGTARAAR
jgi:UMF1 family MFS transporter